LMKSSRRKKRCLRSNCPFAAEEGSNYCHRHRPRSGSTRRVAKKAAKKK
jgi:hypothetical protein